MKQVQQGMHSIGIPKSPSLQNIYILPSQSAQHHLKCHHLERINHLDHSYLSLRPRRPVDHRSLNVRGRNYRSSPLNPLSSPLGLLDHLLKSLVRLVHGLIVLRMKL
jgi:hypothetical protein